MIVVLCVFRFRGHNKQAQDTWPTMDELRRTRESPEQRSNALHTGRKQKNNNYPNNIPKN